MSQIKSKFCDNLCNLRFLMQPSFRVSVTITSG